MAGCDERELLAWESRSLIGCLYEYQRNTGAECALIVQDDAAILEPFVPRLGRMADAFSTDLGIDVLVSATTYETPMTVSLLSGQHAPAILKAAPRREDAPDQGFWLTLDADGKKLPSDWYLRLAGEITRMFHGQRPADPTLPKMPLQ